jgi:hypothetical protein
MTVFTLGLEACRSCEIWFLPNEAICLKFVRLFLPQTIAMTAVFNLTIYRNHQLIVIQV